MNLVATARIGAEMAARLRYRQVVLLAAPT
jgi:hypothetical protein